MPVNTVEPAMISMCPTQLDHYSRGLYLECSSKPEYSVVSFFGRETLKSELDDVVFFGDQVVRPGMRELDIALRK